MKFRKKPVVIEATQWWPPGHAEHIPIEGVNAGLPPELQHAVDNATSHHDVAGIPRIDFWIPTLEGWHVVSPGDWIITGIKGEKYPCKPDVFEATYAPEEECFEKEVYTFTASTEEGTIAYSIGWGRMPPPGVNYFDHKFAVPLFFHQLGQMVGRGLYQWKAGIKAIMLLSTMPGAEIKNGDHYIEYVQLGDYRISTDMRMDSREVHSL